MDTESFEFPAVVAFQLVESDLRRLETRGRLTLECLQAGVKAVFVYPEAPKAELKTRAEQSADQFRDLAAAELSKSIAETKVLIKLVPLKLGKHVEDEGKLRWASEYLTPYLRWTLYQRPGSNDLNPRNLLVASRSLNDNKLAFSTVEAEEKAFLSWFELFCE